MAVSWEVPEIDEIPFAPRGDFFIKSTTFHLFFDEWLIFDVPDYYADNLFIKHKVPVIFWNEYAHNDWVYKAILCKSPKIYRKRFLDAMRELPYVMALNGHGDYEDFCEAQLAFFKADPKE